MGPARMITTTARRVPPVLALLAILFFVSGTSALIYQVLWLRLLGLVFGVTVYAASTVWAAFMAGLALGSLIGGRAADRARRPLVWLAAAEALIGLTALATPFALDLLQRAYAVLHPSLNSSLVTLTLVRLAISLAVLIVPSSLMGATLPLIVKSSIGEGEASGGRVSVLYATNTTGAIAGSLLAGLYLIPELGIRGSFLVAAALNAVVALTAAWAGVRSRSSTDLPDEAVGSRLSEQPDVEEADLTPAAAPVNRDLIPAVVLGVFAVSGFVSLALEVVWFRIVTLLLRPTVYGYALMLAAVLGGIAIGSYAAAPLLRRRPDADWLLPLGWLEGLLAIASLLSFATLPLIPSLMATAGPAVAAVTGDYLAYQTIISVAVIMPTMLLFGAAFPIGLHVWTSPSAARSSGIATRVGLFYSLNVALAILGSLGTGFVLLPRFGSLKTMIALAAVSLLSAFALLAVSRTSPARRLVSATLIAVLFAAAVRITPDPFIAFLAQRYPGESIVWQREAVQATVSVHREPGGTYTLNTNGNHQASTSGATPRVHQRPRDRCGATAA